ncbi:hypothetical protein I7I48_10961 [Histoplasma ohiense]|nr:hypothetical protein I7I48_10961 [Histoplasma ohiense (nom. inval.)]
MLARTTSASSYALAITTDVSAASTIPILCKRATRVGAWPSSAHALHLNSGVCEVILGLPKIWSIWARRSAFKA